MSESLESRVARLEEDYIHIKEDRIESRGDRKYIIHKLDAMSQAVQSMGGALATLSLEKCGERLDSAEKRLVELERHTEPLPLILPDLLFWSRVIGTGWRAAVRIAAFTISTGLVGIILNDWWHGRL